MTTTITARASRAPLAARLALFARKHAGEAGGFFALIAVLAITLAGATAIWGLPGLVSVAVVLTPVVLALLVAIARP